MRPLRKYYHSFLPFNHIYGLAYFLCGGIYLGAKQVLMARFDAEECLHLVERHRVTVIFSVQPALLAFLNLPSVSQYVDKFPPIVYLGKDLNIFSYPNEERW